MQLSYHVALEVATHEALVRQAYRDSVGKLTWSIGLTNACGHKVGRYVDNPQSTRRCLEVFCWALENYAEAVRAEFAGHELTEAQFAAAMSFHWNTGAIESADWVDAWKRGDETMARKSIMDWRKPPEIVDRRRAEMRLFFDGEWSQTGTIAEYTRLTRRRRPVWSSRIERDVAADLAAVLSPEAPEPDGEEDMQSAFARIVQIARPFASA